MEPPDRGLAPARPLGDGRRDRGAAGALRLLLRLGDRADHGQPRQAACAWPTAATPAPPTALTLTEDKERLIGAILLGNNLVNILAASLATALFTRLFGDGGVAIATLVMTALVLIFSRGDAQDLRHHQPGARRGPGRRGRSGVVVRRALADGERGARLRAAGPAGSSGSRPTRRRTSSPRRRRSPARSRCSHSEGGVEKADRDRLLGALDLGAAPGRGGDAAPPRHRDDRRRGAARPRSCRRRSIRRTPGIPIFRGEPENIVGVIHAKDLSRAVHRFVQRAPRRGRARGLRHHGRGDGALLRAGIDAARRADARVPAPAVAFRAGGRRVRGAAGADHARGHHRGDRRRHRRRARRRDAGRHRAACRTARSRSRAA